MSPLRTTVPLPSTGGALTGCAHFPQPSLGMTSGLKDWGVWLPSAMLLYPCTCQAVVLAGDLREPVGLRREPSTEFTAAFVWGALKDALGFCLLSLLSAHREGASFALGRHRESTPLLTDLGWDALHLASNWNFTTWKSDKKLIYFSWPSFIQYLKPGICVLAALLRLSRAALGDGLGLDWGSGPDLEENSGWVFQSGYQSFSVILLQHLYLDASFPTPRTVIDLSFVATTLHTWNLRHFAPALPCFNQTCLKCHIEMRKAARL